MSRSNPTQNAVHPCIQWMEWNGEKGNPRYYDKENKVNVDLPTEMTFVVLDQTSTVSGWDESSKSSIFANEVRDTRYDSMQVKSFKGGVIAEGLYAHVRDTIKAAGGKFTTNIYILQGDGEEYTIACIRMTGAALNAWIEFFKKHRTEVEEEKAVSITGVTQGQKGAITFQVPVFELCEVTEQDNQAAMEQDKLLQEYFKEKMSARPEAQPVITEEPEGNWPDQEPPEAINDGQQNAFPEGDSAQHTQQ